MERPRASCPAHKKVKDENSKCLPGQRRSREDSVPQPIELGLQDVPSFPNNKESPTYYPASSLAYPYALSTSSFMCPSDGDSSYGSHANSHSFFANDHTPASQGYTQTAYPNTEMMAPSASSSEFGQWNYVPYGFSQFGPNRFDIGHSVESPMICSPFPYTNVNLWPGLAENQWAMRMRMGQYGYAEDEQQFEVKMVAADAGGAGKN